MSFCVIRRRIQSGHVMNPLNINYQYLRDTKEYQATEIMTQLGAGFARSGKVIFDITLTFNKCAMD